jgi:hypothetical protein
VEDQGACEVEMYRGKTDVRFVQIHWSASSGLARAIGPQRLLAEYEEEEEEAGGGVLSARRSASC